MNRLHKLFYNKVVNKLFYILRRDIMDLHQLKYVIEIARTHSISRASENLFISQSTLSQFLTKLEGELGINLFERKRNEMLLTPAGQAYVEVCENMLREKKELYNRLADMTQSRTGRFSVGITPQWGAVALSHIIVPFYNAYPNVQIEITEEIAVPLIRLLKERKIDMGIIPLPDNSSLPPESILLQTEELILAVPKRRAASLPLIYAGKKLPQIDVAALEGEPMIFSQKKTTIRQLEDRCFASGKITPNIVAEINSHPASLIMTEQEFGCTFVPASCITPSEKIVYAHVNPIMQWFVVIAFRKGFVPRQSEKYFISLVREFFEQQKLADPCGISLIHAGPALSPGPKEAEPESPR